jgi:two-component system alkaline phosphatase synthesis response regulator PhoP
VLIVDDNDELLASLRFALGALGPFQIVTASDGGEGLTRASELHPDCIIIDVKMPGVDGLRLARTLRGDAQTASIPLVILSALIQEKDQTVGMLAGADQYLTKPTKPQELVAAILRAIRLSEEERLRRMQTLATQDDEPGE